MIAWHLIVNVLAILISELSSLHQVLPPFFFMCHYQGELGQLDLGSGEVSLSVVIQGNPDFYIPGQSYEVIISSSSGFDGVLITGLYTSSNISFSTKNSFINNLNTMSSTSNQAFSQNFMCSIVHSHISRQPSKSLHFSWIAPSLGTGCVDFIVTATLNQHVIFKDALALQLCEVGTNLQTVPLPQLAALHKDGIIFRDDFDSNYTYNSALWTSSVGGHVGSECGHIFNDNASIFCETLGKRELITVALNTSTAGSLQFSLGAGTCSSSKDEPAVVIFFGVENCSQWQILDTISVPVNIISSIFVIPLPETARTVDVCFKWEQEYSQRAEGYQGCWALDNVLITNTASLPKHLYEMFDPINPSQWLFFSEAVVKRTCYSDGFAIGFHGHHIHKFITTIDLDLFVEAEDAILTQDFEDPLNKDWLFVGNSNFSTSTKSMVFIGNGLRKLCTPYWDASAAGNVRFYLSIHNSSSEDFKLSPIQVSAELWENVTFHLLQISVFKQKNQIFTIPITNKAQTTRTRFCWQQTNHSGMNKDTWTLDNIQLLPWVPKDLNYVIQFSINLACGKNITENRLRLQFSNDYGQTWHPLHTFCLPNSCSGKPWFLSNQFATSDMDGWTQIILPLPYSALSKATRFRWKQPDQESFSNWAIDNVYIGACPAACNGHGICEAGGCRCDLGYRGTACENSTFPLPNFLSESFPSSSLHPNSNILQVHGASLSYNCGILGAGKAVLFDQDALRQLTTTDLNTTNAKVFQLSVRLGSSSHIGKCPSPNHLSEGVFSLYSCNGGLTWEILQELDYKSFQEPRHISIPLPETARGPSCRFRLWQLHHSGSEQDMWAIDDIAVTSQLYNTISLNFSDYEQVNKSLRFYLGKLKSYCGSSDTLSFSEAHPKDLTRYLETKSLNVGPSYMIQFELVMGCGQKFSPDRSNHISLEYSTNHGITWLPVYKPCLSTLSGCVSFTSGTVYDFTEFGTWKRVTLNLPPETWSSSTRFRLRQAEFGDHDIWAVDNFYVGQQCPNLCSGHGLCTEGVCKCDAGFLGESCIPKDKLPAYIRADFEDNKLPNNLQVTGGKIVLAGQGCGPISSGNSLYFHDAGVRQLMSKDLNTHLIDFIHFFIKIGGGDIIHCNNADTRNESVLLQFSNDGGINWILIKELYFQNYHNPMFEHISLPYIARTNNTRIRWWQADHSGKGQDQWAIDEIYMDKNEHLGYIQDDFKGANAYSGGSFSVVTLSKLDTYCSSEHVVLVLNGEEADSFVVTKELYINKGNIIQFYISIGCAGEFSYDGAVRLEFTLDSGMTWQLVQESCYPLSTCLTERHEDSIYYPGTHSNWSRVAIVAPKAIIDRNVMLRWIQERAQYKSFALDKIYIGPACQNLCSGHGWCHAGSCVCDKDFLGPSCSPISPNPAGMVDRFDNLNEPSSLWLHILGGSVGIGCGVLAMGQSLYFDGEGTREAQTKDLDTTGIRLLQFMIQLGRTDGSTDSCKEPTHRNENILVQYSNNGGLTWQLLKDIDYKTFSQPAKLISIELPENAQTRATNFKWWQPLGMQGSARTQWALDNVLIAANDTSSFGFQDNFSPMKIDSWYITQNAIPKISCDSPSPALEFNSDSATQRLAETWDFHITPSMFLQFDIMLGCSHYSSVYNVHLEYSLDMGWTWSPVIEECIPPNVGCNGYHLSSDYMSDMYSNWTRITVLLPARARSPSTRFRWLQTTTSSMGEAWALDNIYLGDGCPWMCSGHGYCNEGKCVCDSGYFGLFCVPQQPLLCGFRDTFDQSSVNKTSWGEVYGAEIGTRCGTLVSGMALTFYKDGIRQAVTWDMDCTGLKYIQYSLKYGCRNTTQDSSRSYSILLQFSNNGGITWHLLKEMHYAESTPTIFFTVPLALPSMTNATRFRFWQPKHNGFGTSEWALDDVIVGGLKMNPNILYDTFQDEPQSTAWLSWPGGKIDSFCEQEDSGSTQSALVFQHLDGEHSLYSVDLSVSENTVIQFDIKVGCRGVISSKDPVRLEFSSDQGRTWALVQAPFVPYSMTPECHHHTNTPSIYFSNAINTWRRIVIQLQGLHICGDVRFRWTQGIFSISDTPPFWAIRNVYIGPACERHCSGHGKCLNGATCSCDFGYDGCDCYANQSNANFLKENFEEVNLNKQKWLTWSGAEVSRDCGSLITGASLHFYHSGERILETVDLDLSYVGTMQFYIKLGCNKHLPNSNEQPIMLQYSTNGGISWILVEEFDFNEENFLVSYIALQLPEQAQTNATRIRWWQPSLTGEFLEDWAIDQIFIGGDVNGIPILSDDFAYVQETNWILLPGSRLEPVCMEKKNVLSFSGNDDKRYAITTDVMSSEYTYIQFDIYLGCKDTGDCYSVQLEYSTDLGKSWSLLEHECTPGEMSCSEFYQGTKYTSDVYYGKNRITIPLPPHSRSRATRFRWIQLPGFKASHTWSIGQVYIGDECFDFCQGHGRCDAGQCICDAGWVGESCEKPKRSLPTRLKETFSLDPSPQNWLNVNGGFVSDLCGPVSTGKALLFYGACIRQLISTDLDLQASVFIQFYIKTGCISPPLERDHGILVQYSTNGGISWTTLTEVYYDQHREPGFVFIKLPGEAQKNVVRIRWWQPKHNGRAQNDWAIDNILIGGDIFPPNFMKDLSNGKFSPKIYYLTFDNIEPGFFCGSSHKVVIGSATSNENAILGTVDFEVKKGFMLQFSISLGCKAAWDARIEPLHLQYSTDYGVTWNYVTEQCLPSDPHCGSEPQMRSVYFYYPGWKRITIALRSKIISKHTRFRWIQYATKEMNVEHNWALRDVYMGPSCTAMCTGHGICDYPHCLCDDAYDGPNCYLAKQIPSFLVNTFNDPQLNSSQWTVQGGIIEKPCQEIIDGTAIVFSGDNLRMLETRDLDLRDTRFVQYVATIGGSDPHKVGCYTPSSRDDGVILQYSVNGGISWKMLHELDYLSYQSSQYNYFLLPMDARKNSTRLRWWQGLTSSPRPRWAIDNIYIGGSEINPSQLQETFHIKPSVIDWWFYPNGKIESGYCSHFNEALVWKEEIGIQSLTTRELIVGESYVIQFKISVGCGERHHECNVDQVVALQFSKYSGSSLWEELLKDCFPSNDMMVDCTPYMFHAASTFTANQLAEWKRITIVLPEKTFSSFTQFRWIQQTKSLSGPSWAIDDVYIGEACPDHCNGHGDCVGPGQCRCDTGFEGRTCVHQRILPTGDKVELATGLIDGFESGISFSTWISVKGGDVGLGCGPLGPYGHGKHLYFNGCGLRQAVTAELDTSLASKIMFILRIGSPSQISSCNVDLKSPRKGNKAVLLQYSINNGIHWSLIATHDPDEFINQLRVAYDIPEKARKYGTQFRWWQPEHDGIGHDQWALDNVEIVLNSRADRYSEDKNSKRQA